MILMMTVMTTTITARIATCLHVLLRVATVPSPPAPERFDYEKERHKRILIAALADGGR